MGVRGLENVGIVVDDLDEVTGFFVELGLEVQGDGAARVRGDWVDRCVGLEDVDVDVVMLQTPDGHGRLEVMSFRNPPAREGDRDAPPNTHGLRRIAFSVDDIDAAVEALGRRGVAPLDEVVQYEDLYRMCYVRGPEGIIVMLAEELS